MDIGERIEKGFSIRLDSKKIGPLSKTKGIPVRLKGHAPRHPAREISLHQ
jgi:hypothetical protein